jgi:5-methylcytosine-specific restriction enzyme subunit McrC
MKRPELIAVLENGLIGREYASAIPLPGLVTVPDDVFLAIRQFVLETEGADELLTLFRQKGRDLIRVRNYVGLLLVTRDIQLEILPKVGTTGEGRASLLRMLRYLRHSPFKTLPNALTSDTRLPLWDIFVSTFLTTVEALVGQGIQQTYRLVDGNERYWKGKFQASRQQRENAWHAERLAVRYDVLTADVPPNRILKTTLLYLQNRTVVPMMHQRIRQLLALFDDVSPVESVADALRESRRANRLFARYEPALRWAEALLGQRAYGVKTGSTTSLSLLFPMEQVFEDYVAHGIRTYWPEPDRVTVQESSAHLVDEHAGTPRFKLRPDILIRQANRLLVLDTKWKRLDSREPGGSYGIDQADLYQLYAYGKKYGADDLFLIYPANEHFQKPIPSFDYDASTRLHIVSVDPRNRLADEVEKLVQQTLTK